MFHFLPGPLHTLVPFAIVLGVLVFFHELGHYLAARWRGVHVEAFSIGFGKPFARWTDRVGTEWRLGWLPLGGYVKLHGQERPQDVADEVRASWQAGRTFQEKSLLSRAIVIAAGPFANFLLAAVILTGLFAVAGRPVSQPNPPAVVGDIALDSAAGKAGLEPGDVILRINGTPVSTFEELRAVVSARPGAPLTIDLRRGEVAMTVALTNGDLTQDGKRIGQLGIGPMEPREHVSLPGAVAAGVVQTAEIGRQTLAGLWMLLSGHGHASDLGGMLRIAQVSGQVADHGAFTFLVLIASLSVNIGLLNLFPIPILDGGHLVFYAIEAVRGRPLPPRAMEYGFRAGFAVIAAVFLFAFINDLTRLGVLRWFGGLIGHT